MTSSTRNFLIGAVSVVVIGLGTGLVAYYAGVLPGRDTARAEFAYIPADASAVAFADVRGVMNSEFRQKLRRIMPTGGEKDRLLQETGIDLERDIDSVVVSLKGTRPADGSIVIFRGRFDRARIDAVATANGARQEQYGGVAMLVGLTPSSSEHAIHVQGDHVPALAFLDADLLAIGHVDGIRAAIDVAAAGQGVATNADLMRVINGVEASADAWLVGHARYLVEQYQYHQIPGQVRSQLEGIDWVTVNANVDRDVHGVIRAETRDESTAQELRSVIGGLLAATRMFAELGPLEAEALGSLRVAGTGSSVELSFRFPGHLLDKFETPDSTPSLPAPRSE